jgi:hypothetical protein
MAGVETDAEVGIAVEPVDQGGELVDRSADRVAGPGGVLDQQPGGVGAALEALPERGNHTLQPSFESGALVRADMEDHAFRFDPAGDVHGVF